MDARDGPDSGPVSTDAAEPRTLTVGMAGEGDVEAASRSAMLSRAIEALILEGVSPRTELREQSSARFHKHLDLRRSSNRQETNRKRTFEPEPLDIFFGPSRNSF